MRDTNVATQQFGKEVEKVEKKAKGLGSTMKSLGKVIIGVFAIKKIVSFGRECMELGSNLSEVQNVVDNVFTTMSGEVDEFAKNAATQFGLSETMAKQFIGTFGAMSKSFGFTEKEALDMSTTLAGLSGDVASFYNMTQEEAFGKLKSVFTGETEALKSMGIVMSQTALDAFAMANGFGKTTKDMSEQEKVALRYRFVMDQLSTASGDFLRTSDGWANQTRLLSLQFNSLKATIGQGLINVLLPVIRTLNVLLQKLGTVANAFKAFTELITGNKSSGENTQSAAADTVADVAESYEDASSSADDYADSTKKSANATKQANKQLTKYLSGLDQIHTFTEESSTDSSSPSSGGGTGTGIGAGSGGPLGSDVDFGNLAEGETVIDKVNDKFSDLLKFVNELKEAFKEGFKIGFGDSLNTMKSIKKELKSIKKSLKDIFGDKNVQKSAENFLKSFAENVGKVSGSFIRIGTDIADNIVGGIDEYLKGSKDYIKERIISMFDVTSDMFDLSGNFAVAIADFFDVFTTPEAKSITGHMIGIFSDGALGATDLLLKFVRDTGQVLVQPFINNVDTIKTSFEGLLGPIDTVFGAIHDTVQHFFERVNTLYDEHLKPFIDSITEGLSSIIAKANELYQEHVVPILDTLAQKFETVMSGSINPLIDSACTLIGDVIDILKELWEGVVVPFVNWIQETLVPVLAPILGYIGEVFMGTFGFMADIIGDVLDALDGLILFVKGVFQGDWKTVFTGIKKIVKAWGQTMMDIFDFAINTVLQPFLDFFSGVFDHDFTEEFGMLGMVVNGFRDTVEIAIMLVRNIFQGILDFMTGVFTTDWSKVWDDVTNAVSEKFRAVVDFIKEPLNEAIDLINKALSFINSKIDKINDALSFDISVKNPVTGTKYSFGYKMNIPHIPSVPYLASGAVIPPNSKFLAMLGDQTRGMNIETPEALLRKIFQEEFNRRTAEATQSGGSYQFIAQINRRVLFDEFISEAKLRQMQTGRNPLII